MMTTFKHGDRVVSTSQKDVLIEAEVDFETPDGRVYISEWGKSLSNPMRIVLDKKFLVKKEKKIVLTKDELQRLIYEFYPNPINVDDLDKEFNPEEGFIFVADRSLRYEYLGRYGSSEDKYIFRLYSSNVKEYTDDSYYVFTRSDLQEGVVKTSDVLNFIFGTGDDAMFDVVLDNNENENV